MSDNEHTLAPLRQAEKLSVKNRCGDPVAESCQAGEEAVKITGLIDFFKFSKESRCSGVKSGFDSSRLSNAASLAGCLGLASVRRIRPRGMDAGDVLPKNPGGAIPVNNSKKDEGQVATRV